MPVMRFLLCVLALLPFGEAIGADPAAQEIRKTADRVLAAIEANDAQALGRTMSPYMLAQASSQKLLEISRTRRMHEFREVNWNPARHTDVVARLDGMATLDDGAKRWLNMRFVKRNEGWRLALVGIENADAIDEPAALDVPSKDSIEKLLAALMRDLVEGIRTQSFDRLYASMPSNIGEQFELSEMNTGLLSKLKRKDYAAALKLKPVLDAPAKIEDHGILWLEGHYPTEPPIRFRHGFQYERGAWHLLRFAIDPPER